MRWARALRDLKTPSGTRIMSPMGLPIDHARNQICQTAVDRSFDWVFFCDDDTIPPPDAIEKLMRAQTDIISGLCYRRQKPIKPVALLDTPPKPTFVGAIPKEGLLEVDLVGAACLLIRRRILEVIKKPWFEWHLDREDLPEADRLSEDFIFCRKARALGVKIFIDPSVKCWHVGDGYSGLGEDVFTPLEYPDALES